MTFGTFLAGLSSCFLNFRKGRLSTFALGAAVVIPLVVPLPCQAASGLKSCDQGAAKYHPCELQFEWTQGELAAEKSPFRDELVNIEFRGPDATTYLIRGFWEGAHAMRVRFTPNRAGTWTYRTSSTLKRFDNHEATFSVSDTAEPGFISIANVRHWWTDDKQPHLWLSAEVPWMELSADAYKTFVDARKKDGFTHLRGVLLTEATSRSGPPLINAQPNVAYFNDLDERLIYAHEQGLALDLILADQSFLKTSFLNDWSNREALIRYLIARYGALNVDWQGFEHFDQGSGRRAALKEIGALLQKYDAYRHPRSTDAQMTSSVLLQDEWENFIVNASADFELGAVERQITAAPQIHVVQSLAPDAFRHELWLSTTNGEYPTIPYQAIQNAANLQAVRVWIKIMSGVRHWEFEPFFDVDGVRAVGLDNVEYLLYAPQPGTVEIAFSEKHKYNPRWINPATGETLDLKDVKQDTYSQVTPAGGAGDWILQMPREGKKEGMLKSYKFDSVSPPVQEIEYNTAKVPFEVVEPAADSLDADKPTPFQIRIKRPNRATRQMQYMWTGEVVADGEGPRVIALGASGTLQIPPNLIKTKPALLNVRINAINANGKAYAFEKVYQIPQ